MAEPCKNLLLLALPPADRERLMAKLEPVPMPVRTELFAPRSQPRYAHFLTSGIASLVSETSMGEGVEVGLIGHEGMPECLHLLGPQTGEARCFMQIEGTALRMSFRSCQEFFDQSATFRATVLLLVQYESLLLAQIAACNRLHGMEERLARWLVMCAERTGKLGLDLTQEFLSEMLGARRSTVTLTAGTLQRAGLIQYQRGHVQIVDRDKLEQSACECLAVTQRLLRQLYQ